MSVSELPQTLSAVLFLYLWGSHIVSSTLACPDPCICENTFLNCTGLDLSKVPSHIPATTTALDLSHNALGSLAPFGSGRVQLQMLRHFWVENNSLQNLSLCLGKSGMGIRTLKGRKNWCVSWAPNLQLLSAERNQLRSLPTGLQSVKSLQVLQLSYNKISELGPTDLAGFASLSKLYLQHNRINIIHPKAFQYLQNLKVLDLSYNLLTTVPMQAYLPLRNMNTLVGIAENKWRCDCTLKTLRRWLSFDHDLGHPSWNMICSSPLRHAGKDLTYLKETDLTCPKPVYSTSSISKELTVEEGMDSLLSCAHADQDSTQTRWWTPQGQLTDSQQFLLISNVTEQHGGLYVCVSGFQEEHVSVFHLYVKKRVETRLRREVDELLEEENFNRQKNVPAVSQGSDFALAVSLSVIITFIVAFALGVLLRPVLDKCCKKLRTKKDSTSSSTSKTSNEPMPYENKGYSDADEQEVQTGSRVRFGEVTEIAIEGGVQYYVTVEDPSLDNLSNCDTKVEVHKEVPLKRENKEISDVSNTYEFENAETHKDIEIKHIKDSENTAEEEEQSTSSAPSCSEEHHELYFHEVQKYIEQNVDSSSVGTYKDDDASSDQNETMLEFTTDPFLGIPKYKEQSVDELDPDLWNDSGESFSFNEGSQRSSGRVSQLADHDHLLTSKEISVDNPSDEQYSNNSCESGELISTPFVKRSDSPLVHEIIPPDYANNFFGDVGSLIDYPPKVKRYIQFTSDIPIQTQLGTEVKYDTSSHQNFFQTIGVSFYRLPQITRYIQFTRKSEVGSSRYIVKLEDNEQKSNYEMHYTKNKLPGEAEAVVGEPHTGTRHYSCSSTESGESEGGPKEYTVNPEYKDLETNSDRYDEDVVIRIDPIYRQDTITLDPSDMHMTFTHMDSFDDDFFTDNNYPNPSDFTNNYEDEPKQYNVHPVYRTSQNTSSILQSDRSETEKSSSSENENDHDDYYPRKLAIKTEHGSNKTFHETISFTNPENVLVINHDNSSSSTDKEEKSHKENQSGIFNRLSAKIFNKLGTETNEPVQSSTKKANTDTKALLASLGLYLKQQPEKEDVKLITEKDYFLLTIPESYDQLPKLKRSIWFSVCEPLITEAKPKTEKFIVSSSTEDIFFENIGSPVTPQVKQNQSSHILTQAPSHINTTIESDDFFSQIGASFDTLPKVKRYLPFLPTESHLSTISTLPASMEKVEIPKFESRPSTNTTTFKVFFKGNIMSLYSPPKVQRYIHFTLPQISAQSHSTPTKPTMILPEFPPSPIKISDFSVVKDFSPPENFFRDIGSSVDDLPKIKTYIQFTQFDTSSQTQKLGTEVKINNTADKNKSDAHHNFFQLIGVSLDGLPKITRYIQFTQLVPQSPSHSQITQLVPQIPLKSLHRPVVKPNHNDNFFEEINASFCESPKVNRYIHFTNSSSVNTHKVNSEIRDIQTEFSRPGLSVVDVKPTSIENNFFEQIETSFYSLPKVTKYIKFKQSSTNALWQSQPPLSVSTQWVTESKKTIDSPKEEIKPVIKLDNIFEIHGLTMATVPKLKRSLKFLAPTESIPATLSQEISTRETFFQQIDIPVNDIPKIKRYIQFKNSIKAPSMQFNEDILTESSPKTDAGISDFSSVYDIGTDTEKFKWQRISSFHGVPKVKKYIQFSQSVYPSTEPSSDSIQWVTKSREPRVSFKEDIKIANKGENFFENMDSSVNTTPKLKRYIMFKQIEFPSLRTDVTPELQITQNKKVGSLSVLKEDCFFGQIDTHNVPKVKTYIQFKKSELQPSFQSPLTYSDREQLTKELETKIEAQILDYPKDKINRNTLEKNVLQFDVSSNGVPKVTRYIKFSELNPSTQTVFESIQKDKEFEDGKPPHRGNMFFDPTMHRQIDSSLEVPKVKRFIQFTRSEPQPLVQPSISITPGLPTANQSKRPDELSAIMKRDDFFEDIGTHLSDIQKVKKYIKFTKFEPFIPAIPVSTDEKTKTPSLKEATDDEHNIFKQTSGSFSKVKTYLQFTQSTSQHTSLPLASGVGTPKLEMNTDSWGSKSSLTKSNENIFFDKVDCTFHDIPKVKRYIPFTNKESHLSDHLKTGSVTATRVEYLRPGILESFVKPTMTDDDFFVQTEPLFSSLPKVKRYIQFSQFNPNFSSQSQSKYSLKHTTINESTLFEGLNISIDNIPKVRKSLKFAQSVAQSSNQTIPPYITTETVIPQLVIKTKPVYPSSNLNNEAQTDNPYNFLGQPGALLNGVPKVNKYMQFSNFINDTPNQSSSVNVLKYMHTESEQYSGQFMDDIHIFRTHNLFESGSSSSNSIARVKFAYSEDTDDSVPPSLKTERLRPVLKTSKETSKLASDSRPVPKPRKHSYQSVSDPPLASLEQDDSKEYLRDSSLARQKQERRRMVFQQKRRAMDGFTLSPQSTLSLEDDQQSNTSVPHNVTVQSSSEQRISTVSENYREVDLPKYESHRTKLSSLRTKSTMQHGTVKHSDV